MKTQFRIYMSDRPARFTYSEASLVLVKNDQFQLTKYDGRAIVVKDGVRYPIKADLVPALVARSELVKPSKEYVAQVQNFDALGHKALKYITNRIRNIADGRKLASGFKNNTAYAGFQLPTDHGELGCFVIVKANGIAASIYSPIKFQSVPKTVASIFGQLRNIVTKTAAKLQKEGYKINDFRATSAHVGNLKTPDGKPFSGTVYHYGASTKLEV